MFMLLPIVAALASDPVPAPATSPAPQSGPAVTAPASTSSGGRPTPLREIGRVRALPACVPIVAHSNGAITFALDNDRTLAILSTNLHNVNYDGLNWFQRNNALDALMKQAGAVRENSKSGDAEVKRLRELAKASPDPKRQAELKLFADALGGAMNRQQKAANELMRDITIIHGREEAAEARSIMDRDNPPPPFAGVNPASQMAGAVPAPNAYYNKQMKAIGDSIDDMTQSVLIDEGVAADHSIAATSGC